MPTRGSAARDALWANPVGEEAHGISIAIVCKNVPVVTLEKTSVFDANASWMLQAACNSYLKVDRLFEYIPDAQIEKACRKIGLRDENVYIMQLRHYPFLKAVGHLGSTRSVPSASALDGC